MMLWMMRMVLLAMGLQTCGLHSDSFAVVAVFAAG
jgi:hypothetical protein